MDNASKKATIANSLASFRVYDDALNSLNLNWAAVLTD